MYIEPNYKTNEVSGSFWRPDDYMQHVPNAHVTQNTSRLDDKNGVEVSLSANGMNLSNQYRNSILFASEDGVVRKNNANVIDVNL